MSTTTEEAATRPVVVIYGDFNCPFSAAASARAGRLEAAGIAEVDWHAVEHAPQIPTGGEPVTGNLAEELDREIDQILEQLTGAETGLLHRPSRRVNTNAATVAYAGTVPECRRELRRAIFAAYWQHDADIADGDTLAGLGASGVDTELAAAWRRSWLSLPDPIVPAMVLPDGYVSRGLGALARLGDALEGDPNRLRAR